jgi:hypothetical protein
MSQSQSGTSPRSAAPFGTCPQCQFPGPPLVTVVALKLYFTCVHCGFEWSVVPSYVPDVPGQRNL